MDDLILKKVVKFITPCIQLFGIYIIMYGHISPGGGFAGGTIIASSLVLQHITFGKNDMHFIFRKEKALKLISFSLILYSLIKGYSFFGGQFHLPHPPVGVPGNLLSGGFILPLNILIGLTVSSTFYIIFTLFSNE